jgi:SAM-dependent methyltransferase
MSARADSWLQYWDVQTDLDDEGWRKNIALFLDGSREFLPFGAEDRVLDIGSGPGFLADALKDRVRAIHCVDTSARYVEQGRARLAKAKNVKFTQLGADYLDYGFLGNERFTRIVCASVIQYFKSLAEVERLLVTVRDHAEPGARLLIADIPEPRPLLHDLAGLMRTAWRQDYLWKVLRFTVRSLRGDYSRLRKQVGLLTVRREEMQGLLDRLGLRGEWLDTPLTLNDTRRHLLIHF